MYMSIIRTNDQAKQSSRDVEFIVYCMLEALCIVYVQALMYLFGSFCMGVFFLFFLFSTCIFYFYFVSVFTVLSLVTCLDRPM